MSGPTKKDKSFGERAAFIERCALAAGLVVVIGLLVESGPELAHSIIHGEAPPRSVTGNLIVALGVALEVLFSWRALAAARHAELEAEERIAAAEQATAEANLERMKLEKLLAPRFLTRFQKAAMNGSVASASRKELDIFMYENSPEVVRLCGQIYEVLGWSNWRVRCWTVYGSGTIAGILLSVLATGNVDVQESAAFLLTGLQEGGLDVILPSKWFAALGDVPVGLIVPSWDAVDAAAIQLHLGVKPWITGPVTPPKQ